MRKNSFHLFRYLSYLLAIICLILPKLTLAELETVITKGYGEDINSATINAVESALTKVVGTFVDAENFLEKKVKIQDAITKTTENISSNILTYSQGSVKSLDILEVSNFGELKQVTASVTIRIEDFKRYIKTVALGQREIEGASLFAEAIIKKNQGENIAELVVDKILYPARNFEVYEVKIGTPNFIDNSKDAENEVVISIPVTLEINRDFLDNAYRILDGVASVSFKGAEMRSIDRREYGYRSEYFILMFGDYSQNEKCRFLDEVIYANYDVFYGSGGVTGFKKNPQTRFYSLPKSHYNKLAKRMIEKKLFTGTPEWIYHVPFIRLHILNNNGESIFEDYITSENQRSNYVKRYINSGISKIPEGPDSIVSIYSKIKTSPPKNLFVTVDLVKDFEIITTISEDVLKAAASINVELSY